jgi:hypothetical protein
MRRPAVLRALYALMCACIGLSLSIAAHAQTPPPGQGKYTVTEKSLAEAQERAKALHAGPAAWVEEYWDVMPGKIDEFVKTYREEVYSLARKVPGYRGYTVLTNIPDEEHPKRPNLFGERMFVPHYGVTLEGKTFTGRVVNVGNVLRRTHNIVIVHSLQTWEDAEAFRPNMAKAFASKNPGQKLDDHLSKTVFPLAANFWEESFHMITTGLPVKAGTASGGQDADGLNLDPYPSDTAWFKEYFQVDADKLDDFLKAYNETYAVMRDIPGYRGVTIVTTLPPKGAAAKRAKYKNQRLGASKELYVPKPGVMMDGAVKTDTSVNFGSFFRDTYTIITYYEVPWDAKLLEVMQKNWESMGNSGDRLARVTKALFPHARNHWDMQYRALETSLVPLPADGASAR